MATSASSTLLFVICGRSEPIFEAEFSRHNNGSGGSTAGPSDSVTRQNYFVLHSALDLVEKAAWTSTSMYLKVVDKVCVCVCGLLRQTHIVVLVLLPRD
jgi:trafficking protein particle complex subunit 2